MFMSTSLFSLSVTKVASLIIQWGAYQESASASDTKTLPLTYERINAGIWTAHTVKGASTGAYIAWSQIVTLSTFITGIGNDIIAGSSSVSINHIFSVGT